MSDLEKALARAEWFCAMVRRELALPPDGPDAQHWRNWLFMVEQAGLAHRLSGETGELFDDYRHWWRRDPELKSLGGEYSEKSE